MSCLKLLVCKIPSSAPNTYMQSNLLKIFYSLVEEHAQYHWNHSYCNWPNGGAIAIFWKLNLWTGITRASFGQNSWHLFPHVPWLAGNASVTLTSNLRPQIFRHFEQFEKHLYLIFCLFFWTICSKHSTHNIWTIIWYTSWRHICKWKREQHTHYNIGLNQDSLMRHHRQLITLLFAMKHLIVAV